jgi:hypothetical protein
VTGHSVAVIQATQDWSGVAAIVEGILSTFE